MSGRQSGVNGLNTDQLVSASNKLSENTQNQNVRYPFVIDNAASVNSASSLSALPHKTLSSSPLFQARDSVNSSNKRPCSSSQQASCRSCPTVQITADCPMECTVLSNKTNGFLYAVSEANHQNYTNGRAFATASLPKSFTRRVATDETMGPVERPATEQDPTAIVDMTRSLTLEGSVPETSSLLRQSNVNSISDRSSSSSSFDT
jgi:hypothetical protein